MDQDKKQTWEFITKKDLVYIIIFLVFVVVVVFTLKFEDPQYLTDQLSLGATIFSIFLAVIAILISFMQSNESSRQSNQMTKEIGNQSKEIAKMSAWYAALMTEQQDVSEETSEKIVQKVQENKEVPDHLKDEIIKLVEEAKDKQDAILHEKTLIDKELGEFSNYEKHKKIRVDDFVNVRDFIINNYQIGQNVTIDQLREDLLTKGNKEISTMRIRNIILALDNSNIIKKSFSHSKDSKITQTGFYRVR